MRKIRIKPSGHHALHKLGLTTQVPTKLVYLTDGERRQIKMGKTEIQFKPTTPKKMSYAGELSGLIILGLAELGTEKLNTELEQKLRKVLKQENPAVLRKDLAIAPANIYDYLLALLNMDHDWVVTTNR